MATWVSEGEPGTSRAGSPHGSRPVSQASRGRAPGPPVFDYTLDFENIDFRQRPGLYRIGRGEQGVLLVQPYKGEILPHWRFKTAAAAKESSATIYEMFLAY